MNIFLLILLALLLFGLKKADAKDACLKKEHTDAVKGFFIIIVLYSHILPYLTSSGVSFSPILDVPANKIIKMTGQLMVVMFLFYSGYGVMESIQNKGKDYIISIPYKRILSTLVNYGIAIAFFLFMNLLLGIHYPVRQYLLSLIAWESVGQSNWYIFAILCCYLSTFISFSVLKDKRFAFALTVILHLIYIVVLHETKESWWYNIILSYPAGMFVSLNKKELLSFLDSHYLISVIGTLVIFLLCYTLGHSTVVYQGTAVSFGFLIFIISYRLVIKNRFLTWCGKNLFQLYVYQRIPMIALYNLFPELVRIHPYLYVTCCMAVALLFAILIKPISITHPQRIR